VDEPDQTATGAASSAAMNNKRFDTPITLRTTNAEVAVRSVSQALELLTDPDWPVRGPRHRDATETCLKVLEGYRSTQDAEVAFAAAVEEAALRA
jgi:hypothetical protein